MSESTKTISMSYEEYECDIELAKGGERVQISTMLSKAKTLGIIAYDFEELREKIELIETEG